MNEDPLIDGWTVRPACPRGAPPAIVRRARRALEAHTRRCPACKPGELCPKGAKLERACAALERRWPSGGRR